MFNFDPTKFARPIERRGAAVTQDVKEDILEYVKVVVAGLNAEIENIDQMLAKTNKELQAAEARKSPNEVARLKRQASYYVTQKKPLLEALAALKDRWQAHREAQWTGMNGYPQIQRYAIEDVLYCGPFYPYGGRTYNHETGYYNESIEEAMQKNGKPIRCLVAYTDDVILRDGDADFNLGSYRMIIPLFQVKENKVCKDARGIQFVPMRHSTPEFIQKYSNPDSPRWLEGKLESRFPHHLWRTSNLEPTNCWAEFGTSVEVMMATCDIVSLLSLCVKFQFNWNPGSPYVVPSRLPHAERVEKKRRV